jgi:heat shock protein HslJ
MKASGMISLAVCAAFVSCASRKPPSPATQADAPPAAISLVGTEWHLEDLDGVGVLENVEATLTFPEAGKTAGNGSCNRFLGPVEIRGASIHIGPLASTRMACPDAVSNQEAKYLKALEGAERFAREGPHLMIYCKEMEKPLRFTEMPTQHPPAP